RGHALRGDGPAGVGRARARPSRLAAPRRRRRGLRAVLPRPNVSAGRAGLPPAVQNIPRSGPLLDVVLVERTSRLEDGRDVVAVAGTPGDQLVDDHVLGRDDMMDRPRQGDVLVLDGGEQDIDLVAMTSDDE